MPDYLFSDDDDQLQTLQSELGFPRRAGHSMVLLGDSRMAQFTVDGTPPFGPNYTIRTKNVHFLAWAAALNGGLFSVREGYAASGLRSDQYLAYLDQALASDASIVAIWSVVNDISQASITGDTAATIFARIQTAVKKILRAGKTPLVLNEIGVTSPGSYSTANINMTAQYNRLLHEMAERISGVLVFDAASVIWDFTTASFAFKSGYSADGTHLSPTGSYYLGKALGTYLANIMGALPELGGFKTQPTTLLNNPMLLTTTGGTQASGFTGAVPANFTVSKAGSPSCATSVVDAPDGRGKAFQADITVSAADDRVSLVQDATLADFAVGDIIEFACKAQVVSGSQYLKQAALWGNVGGQSVFSADLHNAGSASPLPADLDGKTLTLRSLPYKLVSGFSWVSWQFRVLGLTAGSVSVKVWEPLIIKRSAW
jgi:GDSL-like Lipase/Acylhydrolase family